MAAPESITTLDLSGKFFMNKTLSDSTDEILRLQGVGWMKRKAIGLAGLTLTIKHYKDDEGVERIDIDQTLTGGIPGTTENRILDWRERAHDDHVFGPVLGRSQRIEIDNVEDEYLKQGWLADTQEHGAINSIVKSDTENSGRTWSAEQIWGFEKINEERRYARHVHFLGPEGEDIKALLVYDYLGPLSSSSDEKRI